MVINVHYLLSPVHFKHLFINILSFGNIFMGKASKKNKTCHIKAKYNKPERPTALLFFFF